MAAAVKALNARIRSNPAMDYFFSTHFWGPASNFGIPIAAVMDTQKDPNLISGKMTCALLGYSSVFMRYSMAISPRNYLLFGMHFVNFFSQGTQLYRFTNYWYMGGADKAAADKAKEGLGGSGGGAVESAHQAAEKVMSGASAMAEEAREKAEQAKEKAKNLGK